MSSADIDRWIFVSTNLPVILFVHMDRGSSGPKRHLTLRIIDQPCTVLGTVQGRQSNTQAVLLLFARSPLSTAQIKATTTTNYSLYILVNGAIDMQSCTMAVQFPATIIMLLRALGESLISIRCSFLCFLHS